MLNWLSGLKRWLGWEKTPPTALGLAPQSIYAGTRPPETTPQPASGEGEMDVVVNLWDYLSFRDNTQAFHVIAVLGFEEWAAMEEIRRRVKELFSVEYENDRSLYPYIKTLVDAGLLETLRTERRQKWRKRGLFFKLVRKKRVVEAEALRVEGA